MKLTILLGLILILINQGQGQSLFDDFNGAFVNTNLWAVTFPYGDSSVTEGGGVVSIENNGRLTTQIASPTSYDVSGSFYMANNPYSNFKVVLRTDGTPDGSEAKGIAFQFNIEDDNGTTTDNLRIFSIGNPAGDFTTPTITANLTLNSWHSFLIKDSGTNVALFFDGSLTPTLSTNSTFSVGNKITFYNREGSDGGSSISANGITEIDYLTIANYLLPNTIGLTTKSNGLALSFLTQPNTDYYVQVSSNLKTWTNYDGPFLGDGNVLQKNYSITNQSQLFYRLITYPYITSGLVGLYPFRGNAKDLSDYTNSGSVYGATLTTNRFGSQNSTYYFAGNGNTYISILDSSSLDITNAITLAAWIQTGGGGYAQPRILSKNVYQLGFEDTSSNPQIFFSLSSIGQVISPHIVLNQNSWIFIAGTYDGQSMKFYTNGVLAAQAAQSGSIATNSEPVGIGENLDDYSDYFLGSISDVSIYNRALSATEIQQLYNANF